MMFSGVSGIGSGIGYSTGRTRRLRCCLFTWAPQSDNSIPVQSPVMPCPGDGEFAG